MKAPSLLFAMFTLGLPLAAPANPGATPALLAVAASAPAIMIPVHTAVLMKRELDNQALFVDVDSAPDAVDSLAVDAYVPLRATDDPGLFNAAFLEQVDQARAAKRITFTGGVVVVSRSAFVAMQAAELLRDHGYTLLFAVTSP